MLALTFALGLPLAAQAAVINLNAGDDLQTVIDNATSGDTIRLTGDYSYNPPASNTLIDGKNIRFDLNGFNLSISGTSALIVKNGSVVDYIDAPGTGSFTVVTDGNAALYVEGVGSSCTVTGAQAIGSPMNIVIAVNPVMGGTAIVNGNVTSSGKAYTINAHGGGTAIVNGNINAAGADAFGVVVGATVPPSPGTVTVNGSITSAGYGVRAGSGSTVTINGNITAVRYGVNATEAGTTVTVNGAITAPTYVQLNGVDKTAAEVTTPTTKAGYNTYDDATPTTVWVLAAPVITTPTGALATGTQGTAYSTTLTAINNPTSWTVTGGSLPPGLALGDDGKITGTPTTAGDYSFSVTASNTAGDSTAVAYTLKVGAVPAITTPAGALPVGTQGTAYSTTLTATNNPTSWTVTGGSLPPGLTLGNDGKITGTPTTVGDYSFSAKATNAFGDSTTVAYTLKIGDPGSNPFGGGGNATPVPTLNEWALMLLGLAMLGMAGLHARRR